MANAKIILEDSLDLKQLVTTGSVLAINQDYEEEPEEFPKAEPKNIDFLGHPVKSIHDLAQDKHFVCIDKEGFVKKRIIEEGGGVELHDGCTVSIAYSGYWENEPEPFDVRSTHKPLVIDLKENGLLPGMLEAIRSMLVGETSMFLLGHQLMYGELGIPPRIKPKASCVFYIKLLRSVLTPKQGSLDFEQGNLFQRVLKEARLLYTSGIDLNKTKNIKAAIFVFKKAVNMLQKCRLADENEEKQQEKMLIKLYINLAICYNKVKQPLQACTACNELNRLRNIWNDSKILLQNAKALRMIGAYSDAERRLKRAMVLSPNTDPLKEEMQLLQKAKEANLKKKKAAQQIAGVTGDLVGQEFRDEVDEFLKRFKEDVNLRSINLPADLGAAERDYIKEVCLKENLFCHAVDDALSMDRDDNSTILLENKDNLDLDNL